MGKIAVASVLFLSSLIVALQSASSQDTDIGSRLRPRQRDGAQVYQGQAASQQADAIIGCIVLKRRDLARQFLDATAPQDVRRLRSLLLRPISSCLALLGTSRFSDTTVLRLSPDMERGVIAEKLLGKMSSAAPVTLPLAREYHSPWNGVSTRGPVIEEMAMCVSYTDPNGVRNLLATQVDTDGEAKAFAALTAYMGSCLQANAKLSANRPGLRSALAEELYHREAGGDLSSEPIARTPTK